MDIVIDVTSIINFLELPFWRIFIRIFVLVGWIPLSIAFLWGAKEAWLHFIQTRWKRTNTFILLAIDIPRGNEQTAKAVENLFTYLGGAHTTFNYIEKYWIGKFQLSFSLEIVSIEGYTQFLIRTPSQFQNIVESAVYSQYPDAEITEVDDYTTWAPSTYPDDEYDVYGGEFMQAKNPVYPIKTYKEFEHPLGAPETHYKDPMASLMDLYSSLKKGEHIWFQILIKPTGFDWPEEGEKEIKRIIGEKVKEGDNIFDKIINNILEWLGDFSEMVYKLWGDIEDKKAEEEQDNRFLMMNLKPKEKKQIEAIQEKIGKLGFEFKSRFVYIAKKEVMNKTKAFGGMVGYMKQFMDLDLNNLTPDMKMTVTTADYLFTNYRLKIKQNKVVHAYKSRSTTRGRRMGIMNVEELATIWHFPAESVVKAPLIQKAPGRKAVAPMYLPIGEEIVSEDIVEPFFNEPIVTKEPMDQIKKPGPPSPEELTEEDQAVKESGTSAKGAPPANLPIG